MKKFIKRNWLKLANVFLFLGLIIGGWLKYGKEILNMFAGDDLNELDNQRRRDQERVNNGFDRIDTTFGRADFIEREIAERYKRVQESDEQLSSTISEISDLNRRTEDRIQRNKELIQRLSKK